MDDKKPPRKRDAAATKQKIMQAAQTEFAAKGFDGARVDAIAELADVNKLMLYHYFGNKDELFATVLEAVFKDFRLHESRLKLDHLPADEAILELVEFTWRYYLKHPEFIRLLSNENLLEARHLKQSPNIGDINTHHHRCMAELVRRGIEEGTVRADIEPKRINICIAALGFFYLINRHSLSVTYACNTTSPKELKEHLSVMKDIIARWIRP